MTKLECLIRPAMHGRCLKSHCWAAILWAFCAFVSLVAAGSVAAASAESGASDSADVVVDGHVILKVRGVAAIPAEKRARTIAERIVTATADEDIAPGDVKLLAKDDRTEITAGGQLLLYLFDFDADLEGVSRQVLAEATQLRLQKALTDYRYDRSPRVLVINSLYAAGRRRLPLPCGSVCGAASKAWTAWSSSAWPITSRR